VQVAAAQKNDNTFSARVWLPDLLLCKIEEGLSAGSNASLKEHADYLSKTISSAEKISP